MAGWRSGNGEILGLSWRAETSGGAVLLASIVWGRRRCSPRGPQPSATVWPRQAATAGMWDPTVPETTTSTSWRVAAQLRLPHMGWYLSAHERDSRLLPGTWSDF